VDGGSVDGGAGGQAIPGGRDGLGREEGVDRGDDGRVEEREGSGEAPAAVAIANLIMTEVSIFSLPPPPLPRSLAPFRSCVPLRGSLSVSCARARASGHLCGRYLSQWARLHKNIHKCSRSPSHDERACRRSTNV